MDAGTTARSPLRFDTPAAWVATALQNPRLMLNDHAHLERKAATNALDLIGRWPYPVAADGADVDRAADRWARRLASIARDEVQHLGQVLRLLQARGGHFERVHTNPYAATLRGAVRRGEGLRELLDRLLVSALIEARSGERFQLLATQADDAELARFYAALVVSEEGHYRMFIELAGLLPGVADEIESRWSELLDVEAAAIAAAPAGSTLHGGVRTP
ncbi:MAG: tRNA-(ms[2]io[6]A)-hydroxylase [Planctomycetota bacterium]|nr:tRNA-(ms[2]io[6]A)-hydroxylase [Planctomycetota bacterium]